MSELGLKRKRLLKAESSTNPETSIRGVKRQKKGYVDQTHLSDYFERATKEAENFDNTKSSSKQLQIEDSIVESDREAVAKAEVNKTTENEGSCEVVIPSHSTTANQEPEKCVKKDVSVQTDIGGFQTVDDIGRELPCQVPSGEQGVPIDEGQMSEARNSPSPQGLLTVAHRHAKALHPTLHSHTSPDAKATDLESLIRTCAALLPTTPVRLCFPPAIESTRNRSLPRQAIGDSLLQSPRDIVESIWMYPTNDGEAVRYVSGPPPKISSIWKDIRDSEGREELSLLRPETNEPTPPISAEETGQEINWDTITAHVRSKADSWSIPLER